MREHFGVLNVLNKRGSARGNSLPLVEPLSEILERRVRYLKRILFSGAVLALAVVLTPGMARADKPLEVLSTGKRFDLKKALLSEGTTVLLFVQDSSSMEQQFLTDLEQQLPKDKTLALRVVKIKGLDAPVAQQYEVKGTPAAIIYDRFAHVLARTSQPEEIKAAVRKGSLMGRLKWIDEDDPKAAEFYGYPPAMVKRGIPGIVKTFSLDTDAYQMFNIISKIHFSKRFLTRKEHEMIAAHVSSLNRCKF